MKKLGQGAITTGSGTLLYTVPTGYRTEINDVIVANTTAGSLDFRMHFVSSGGSAATSNAIYYDVQIPANTTVQLTCNQILNTGDFVQAVGSSAGLTVTLSGNEDRVSI